jgi:predicted nucleotidyltransferase
MPNLQIKGIDEQLYRQVKDLAVSENRSVSQQVLHLIRRYLANREQFQNTRTPAQILLELAGSWDDERSADDIVSQLRNSRKNTTRLKDGF